MDPTRWLFSDRIERLATGELCSTGIRRCAGTPRGRLAPVPVYQVLLQLSMVTIKVAKRLRVVIFGPPGAGQLHAVQPAS